MGYKMGRARKIESDDTSALGLPDALDLTIADPADSQILDDQAVLDILESGPYPMLDQSLGDGQDDKEETEATDTCAPDDDITRNLKMADYLHRLVLETETIDSETLRATSGIRRSPFTEPRVSWKQRALPWFRRPK